MWMTLVLIHLLAFCPGSKGNDVTASKFIKTKDVDSCLVNIGVTISDDPVVSSVRNNIHCAGGCIRDGGCSKYLYCPHLKDNCYRVKAFGVYDTVDKRTSCSCYLREHPLACMNGGTVQADKTCNCLNGFYGNRCEYVITDCKDGYDRGSGILRNSTFGPAYIKPPGIAIPFPVLCLNFWGGYTYIQIRPEQSNIKTDFNRNWHDYKHGFGDIEGDFWLGLEQIYALTRYQNFLDIGYIDYSSRFSQLYYKGFTIADESDNYRASMGEFEVHPSTPQSGNSLTPNTDQNIDGHEFITYDHKSTGNTCPVSMRCGWWFTPTCTAGNLNGPYITYGDYLADPTQPRITWLHGYNGYLTSVYMRLWVIPQ